MSSLCWVEMEVIISSRVLTHICDCSQRNVLKLIQADPGVWPLGLWGMCFKGIVGPWLLFFASWPRWE